MNVLVPLTVAVPLLGAAALGAFSHVLPSRAANAVAVAASAAVTVICVLLVFRSAHETIDYWFGGWRPRGGIAMGISFSVDPLGAAIAALVGTLMTAALVFAWDYFEEPPTPYFHLLMLVFLGAMVGFALSSDLFNMFVFFELMSVSAFALTAYRVEQPSIVQGAINFAVLNSIAAFMLMLGIALVYARTGALNLAQVGQVLARHDADGLVVVAFTLLVVGVLVKAGAAPFHFWLSDAYAVAPAPVCVLLAGVMSDLGLHAVARIYWVGFSGALGGHDASAVRGVLVGVGVATVLVGSLMSFLHSGLKRMLAFVVVAHVGLFLIGIALLNREGLAGATVYVIADGLVKGALFLAAGEIGRRLDSTDELELHGRGGNLRLTGVTLAVGGLALAALPPFGTFLGWSLLAHGASPGRWWLLPVLLVGSLVPAAAVLRAAGRIFLGLGEPRDELLVTDASSESDEAEGEHGAKPLRLSLLRAPAVVLLAAGLGIGFAPGVARHALHHAERFENRPAVARHTLHGTPEPSGPLPSFHPGALGYGFGAASALGAIGLACAGLYRRRFPTLGGVAGRAAGAAVRRLEGLHDGVTGDYVAWLTFGTAAIGVLFAVLIR